MQKKAGLVFLLLVYMVLGQACDNWERTGVVPDNGSPVEPHSTVPGSAGQHEVAQPDVAREPTVSVEPQGYEIKATTMLDLPVIGPAKAWLVRKGFSTTGVLVQVKDRLVTLRDPDPKVAGGLPGPEWHQPVPTLEARDLNGDGVAEVVLQGPSGQGRGLWVYHFDPTRQSFELAGELWGHEVTMTPSPSGPIRFEATELDLKGKTVRRVFEWTPPNGFVEVN
jgi:hypothetical protein